MAVRQITVVHIIVEQRLRIDDVDTMSVTSADELAEVTSVEDVIVIIRNIIMNALTRAFNFL